MANTITFKPKQVTKKILSDLSPRAYEVVVNRFGLVTDAQSKTLEAIGKKYGITRERVRQIENTALSLIRKSDSFKDTKEIVEELKKLIHTLGSIVSEHDLLNHVSKDKLTQNHISLFLTLSNEFTKHKEDEHFKTRWSVDNDVADNIHKSLKKLFEGLSENELISEGELVNKFLEEVKDLAEQYKNQEMRKHGSPMHFREVAKAVADTFDKRCHTATCHNELIKDKRFVLVGRGIYALSEWGYKTGVVRDVIKELIKKNGPYFLNPTIQPDSFKHNGLYDIEIKNGFLITLKTFEKKVGSFIILVDFIFYFNI